MTNKQAKRLQLKQKKAKNKRLTNKKLFKQISKLEQQNLSQASIASKLHTSRQQLYRIKKRYSDYSKHRCNSFCPHSIKVKADSHSQSSPRVSSKSEQVEASCQSSLSRKRLLFRLERMVSLGQVSKFDASVFLGKLGFSGKLWGTKACKRKKSKSENRKSKQYRNKKMRIYKKRGWTVGQLAEQFKLSKRTTYRIVSK